jgi:hypothetical protein
MTSYRIKAAMFLIRISIIDLHPLLQNMGKTLLSFPTLVVSFLVFIDDF